MSIKTDLALVYQMGYADALGRRKPEPSKVEDMADGIARENARLRELVRVMAYCMHEGKDCDGCKLNDGAGRIEALDAAWACDGLHDRMRELGVEVD